MTPPHRSFLPWFTAALFTAIFFAALPAFSQYYGQGQSYNSSPAYDQPYGDQARARQDRAWFDRPIFGKRRYMSVASTGKKFGSGLYISSFR